MGQGRLVFALALTSAILAAVVPGVLDAPALATGVPASVAAIGGPETRVPSAPVNQPAVRQAAAENFVSKVFPANHGSALAGKQTPRVRIPVGCERSISALVKSAAATQLSRCLT